MPTILITGVAGFIGSNFANFVLERYPEYKIVGVDNLCTGFKSNIDDRVSFHEIDLLDHDALSRVFEQTHIDYIVHMAAFAAEALSPYCRRHTYLQNIVASANLINCAINHDIKRFMFTSSIASYGRQTPPFKEDMPPIHCDNYGLSKYVTSEDLKIAHEQHGLEYVVLRLFNVYGEGQALNSRYRNVMGIFMNKVLEGQNLTIYGDGEQQRAFTYIGDILPAIWTAMTASETANQAYNIGTEKTFSINELADAFIAVTGQGKKEYLEARHEVQVAFCNVSKARSELGLKDDTDLQSGIAKMWAWAQKQPRRPVEHFKNIEVTKGLYEFWKC